MNEYELTRKKRNINSRIKEFKGGEIGKWLRQKPIIYKWNDIVMVHGGISSKEIAKIGKNCGYKGFFEDIDLILQKYYFLSRGVITDDCPACMHVCACVSLSVSRRLCIFLSVTRRVLVRAHAQPLP